MKKHEQLKAIEFSFIKIIKLYQQLDEDTRLQIYDLIFNPMVDNLKRPLKMVVLKKDYRYGET